VSTTRLGIGVNGSCEPCLELCIHYRRPLLAAHVLQGTISAYGLIVGAYGVGNVLSNLVIGSLVIRRRVAMLFSL